jgi:hypothetical protein
MPGEGHEPSREQGGLSEPAPTLQMVYEPNPKHKPMPTPGRRGSRCPPHADGRALLRSSDLLGKKRYATDGENAYCAQRHDPGNDPGREAWHGYLIGWDEVPPALVTQWVAEEKVQRRTVRRAKRQRER